MITAKQYKKLLPYEYNFYCAVQLNFVRFNDRNDVKILDEIYKELIGDYSGFMSGCNRCVLTATKKLGKLFYEYKEAQDKKKQEKEKAKQNKEEKAIDNNDDKAE